MASEEIKNDIVLLETRELIAHEKVNIRHAIYLVLKMILSGRFKSPLLVDAKTKTVLDGHHRCYAAHRLGLKSVPCYVVDYLKDQSVRVEGRRPEIPVDKTNVIKMALSPKVFPHKTTRHEYKIPGFNPLKLRDLWKKTSHES